MEATFYDESVNAAPQQEGVPGYGYNPKTMKQNMTLNLNDPKNIKPHLRMKASDILTSPDVGLLKLASPELERLIIQSSNGLVTTTPTPTQFLCPKHVTDEQEGFADGFVRALAELHYQQHLPAASSAAHTNVANEIASVCTVAGDSVAYGCNDRPEPPEYTHLATFNRVVGSTTPGTAFGVRNPAVNYATVPPQNHIELPLPVSHSRLQTLKEEPQTVPEMNGETPPLSPIDMENQERIKAERKRMRNRVAASKCRKRKLERLSRLEEKVKIIKTQNTELVTTAKALREQVALLKQKVMDHVNSGCQLILTQQLAF